MKGMAIFELAVTESPKDYKLFEKNKIDCMQ